MNNTTYFSILVNSTDAFEDCWLPFFFLFKKYWSQYAGKIYLNTEIKEFNFSDIDIICIRNRLVGSKWSDCLISALKKIPVDYILYMQEDYFLHSPVNTSLIGTLFNLFITEDLDCLHLTDQCTSGPFNKKTNNNQIWEILPGADYRISTQAAFWKKNSLLKFLEPEKTAWQLERYANRRLNQQPRKIYCVNQDIFKKNKNEILPYIFTGIIKGKWNKEIIDLFTQNTIIVDFKVRGFYNNICIYNRLLRNILLFFRLNNPLNFDK